MKYLDGRRDALRFIRIAALVLTPFSAWTQWLNYPPPGTPLTRDGKPDLSAPAPLALDGHPDLSGVWMHETTTVEELKRLFGHQLDDAIATSAPGMEIGTQHKYGFDILADFKPGETAMRPEGQALYRQRLAARDSSKVCTVEPLSFPYAGLLSEPIKIVQSPRETLILYELRNLHRQIFTDGRKLPNDFEFPAFLGYSVGHWEDDTLVIETAGFNDRTLLDAQGRVHSDALRTTERIRRRDFGHLDFETTLDDPKIYTRPFTLKIPHYLVADQDLFEMYCENEKDSQHMRK